MKITFLGTSHGYPGKNRYCSCNMIEVNGNKYIVDAGAPLCDLLYRREISLDEIKAVFITHRHLDHIQGLPFFLGTAKWHFPNCRTQTYLPDDESINAIKLFLADGQSNPNPHLTLEKYNSGEFYKDENMTVSAIPNKHLEHININSFGFELETNGQNVLFTGDLKHTMEDFPQIAFKKHYNCIITECAHAKVEVLENIIKKINADIIVVNHIFPESKEEELKKLDKKYGSRIIVGKDNDEIII